MQSVADLVLKLSDPKPKAVNLSQNIPACRSSLPDCKTFAYAPQGVPWVKSLMQQLAYDNGLDFDRHFLGFGDPGGPQSPFDFTMDNQTMTEHFLQNFNLTQSGIIFLSPYTSSVNRGNTMPNDLAYWMFYNSTDIMKISILSLERTIGGMLQQRGNFSNPTTNIHQNTHRNIHLEREETSSNGKEFYNFIFGRFHQLVNLYSDHDDFEIGSDTVLGLNSKIGMAENEKKRYAFKKENLQGDFHDTTASNSDNPEHHKNYLDNNLKIETISLDQASMKVNPSVYKKFEIQIDMKPFPRAPLRFAQLNLANIQGGTLYIIPPILVFFMLLTEIVEEKESKLRLGMRMMGLSNFAYWMSWYTHGLMWVILINTIQYAAAWASSYEFVTNSNAFCVLSLWFLFGIAMISFAFWLSTLISSKKTAQTVGYAFILVGFVFQGVMNSGRGVLIDMLWTQDPITKKDKEPWIILIRLIMEAYPPFNLAKAWSDIAALSSSFLSLTDGVIVHGPGFYFQDMERERFVFATETLWVASPPPKWAFVALVIDIFFFGILAWYLDNVLTGEHGSPQPFYFPFTPSYWGFRSRRNDKMIKIPNEQISRRAAMSGELIPQNNATISEYDTDVEVEISRAIETWNDLCDDISASENPDDSMSGNDSKQQSSRSSIHSTGNSSHESSKKSGKFAVLLVKISKLYRRFACCKSSTDTFAVDEVSLSIDEGELFTLLGHNGAGKTTLISMLTGLFNPSSGQASIYGYDLEQDLNKVQELIGVCPQHDVLWSEMTAREHLKLFCQIKGISSAEIEDEVESKLLMVGLDDVGDKNVGGYSGGMKRRLSLAIACIGDPKLIFLDEPSSGLDPVNKRKIWKMIQGMKTGRAIILTTHSMEEAEVLSDRLAIMAFGKVRALGDSLHLKNKYGDGYRVSIVINDINAQNVSIKTSGEIQDPAKSKNPSSLKHSSDALQQNINISSSPSQSSQPSLQATNEFIQDMLTKWNGLKVVSQDSGLVLFGCSKDFGEHSMPDLLDAITTDPRVKEWGLSHSTLESVFLEVTRKHNFVYESIDENEDPNEGEEQNYDFGNAKMNDEDETEGEEPLDDNDHSPLIQGSSSSNSPSTKKQSHHHHSKKSPSPIRALVFKNLTLQWRQRFSTICQIVSPLLIIMILVILKVVIRSQLGEDESPKLVPGVPFAFNGVLDDDMRAGEENSIWMLYSMRSHNFAKDVGWLTGNAESSGILGEIPQWELVPLYDDNYPRANPYMNQSSSEGDMQRQIYTTLDSWSKVSVQQVQDYPYVVQLPDAYVDFADVNPKQTKLSMVMAVNEDPFVFYHRPNDFTRWHPRMTERLRGIIPSYGEAQWGVMVSRAFISYSLKQMEHPVNITPTFSRANAIIVQPMPSKVSSNIWILLELTGTLLYPLGLSLQIPLYLYLLTLEKSEKLREMMLLHGLRARYYHIVNYIFFMTIYIVIAAMFWIAGLAFNSRFFTQTHPSVLAIFLLGWGTALISLSTFLSAFVNSPRVATVIGYIIALFGTAIAGVVSVVIYGPTPVSVKTPFPFWTFIWPQFSLARGMYLLNDACALKGICYGSITHLTWSNELSKSLLGLYLAGIIYYLLFLYFDAVLPREFGIPRHPLFFLDGFRSCFNYFRGKKGKSTYNTYAANHRLDAEVPLGTNSFIVPISSKTINESRDSYDNSTIESSSSSFQGASAILEAGDSDEEAHGFINNNISNVNTSPLKISTSFESSDTERGGSDITKEKLRVKSILKNHTPPDPLEDYPLVINGLGKVYEPSASEPDGKRALNELWLAVGENECFGLLGENGAGKSTTISLLTGMFAPTEGNAFVGGYSIRNQMQKVHLHIGLCPQFDITWSDLTVEEHLLFYARLKGIPWKDEKKHVQKLMKDVGLSNAAGKTSKSLSGGMRRRLSIAISLVGDSKLVFMDEPTTGLDSASRRQIWAIIRRAKKDRAIILTTHSMDEAELLCSRIGILAHGNLMCVGSHQHLKSLFGQGVRLKISTSAHHNQIHHNHEDPSSSSSSNSNDGTMILLDSEDQTQQLQYNNSIDEHAHEWILQTFKEAVLVGDYHGTKEFHVPSHVSVSSIFRIMESQASKHGITDWAVSQIGLEDVFQAVVSQAEKNQNKKQAELHLSNEV